MWSAPAVAVVAAAPAFAASSTGSTLVYTVTPVVTAEAPFGTASVTVTNTSAVDYSGPLTFTTPAWTVSSPFTLDGAAAERVQAGGVAADRWQLTAASVPAGESVVHTVAWDGFAATPEAQPLTVTPDPVRGTAAPSGDATVHSSYQLLWFAAVPGGQGSPSGSSGFFIANTTPVPLTSADTTVRTRVWSFPLPSAIGFTVGGVPYAGQRAVENGAFVAIFNDVPVTVPADGGRLDFTMNWPTPSGTSRPPQQSKPIVSIVTDTGTGLTGLGDLLLYSPAYS
ncbi:hypothetical protein ACOACO_05900 [Nocardioides sp. CPCC 205120]|uniref:hypothetical protein n=1 Tax=Nocardioides sp. CPCC 205120 TaxID=3406462 RepID=UPI003B5010BB